MKTKTGAKKINGQPNVGWQILLLFGGFWICRLSGLWPRGRGLNRQLWFGRGYFRAGGLRCISGHCGTGDLWTLNLRPIPRSVIYDH
jgi:hypothetical protein